MIALVVVLAWAVIRPRGWPEAVAAVPAAVLVIGTGAIGAHEAIAEARRLGPVIGFLAAVLVLAQLCADEGLFQACGTWMARGSGGRPRRLLAQVFAVAGLTTAVLSLDATVVLLTPVVFATAARLDARARPHVYACTHLANSGSLLLPVSNLTNLLAFATSGLAFGRFAALYGAAVAGRHRHRIHRVPPVLCRRPGRRRAAGTSWPPRAGRVFRCSPSSWSRSRWPAS